MSQASSADSLSSGPHYSRGSLVSGRGRLGEARGTQERHTE
jgi:hypothetical protein